MVIPLSDNFRRAISLLRPLLDAERERGNTGTLREGDIRDTRPWWQMRHPLDIRALEAQFVLGPGITVSPERGGVVLFEGRLELGPVFEIRGGEHDGWWPRRRRAAWWATHDMGPATRTPYENPFPAMHI